ncbi:MAG: MFS transporter [Pseudomonadales bacterium]|nr:MFS transporter [Pseudomonadales bacterium]
MKPLNYYFIASGAWFMAYGIQSVIFAWLVTMVLQQPADKVGIAQMAFLLPALFLMLVGGGLSDHFGGRRIAIIGHIIAVSAPSLLVLLIVTDALTYGGVIAFAIIMGCAQALVTPARDGLLAVVADGKIQRRVVQASMIQFGVQMVGFMCASMADQLGAIVVLSLQASMLACGIGAYLLMDLTHEAPAASELHLVRQITRSITEGFNTVRRSRFMVPVVIQNCAMGAFFMGSYIVTIPLLIRESFAGGSPELSWVNTANSLGLVITIFVLLKTGDIRRQGRALLLAQAFGAFMLATGALAAEFWQLALSIFLWGLGGGIAMTMSRTIMQEQAPVSQRSRIMAFYSFSFMGSGPVGALLSGYLVSWFGPARALVISSFSMLTVVIIVSLTTHLWSLGTEQPEMN